MAVCSLRLRLPDVDEFAAGGLLEFEAVGGNVGVQHDFADLQVEAIVVVRAIDADVVRERRDGAAHGRAGCAGSTGCQSE